MLRAKMAAVLVAFINGMARADAWAGEQLLKTLDEIHEYGFGDRVRIMSNRLADTHPVAFGRHSTDRGQLGLRTVLAGFVLVIAAMVVVVVLDEFDQSLGTPSDTNLSNAQTDTLSGFADMVSLIGPLLLIAIGVVIIGLIRRVS